MVKDELHDIIDSISDAIDSTNDVDALKKLLKLALKLLRNTREMYDTTVELRKFDRFLLARFQGSDVDIRFWTGFYSYQTFSAFWEHMVEPNIRQIKYYGAHNAAQLRDFKCGPTRQLASIDELFLTLVKLKQGSANQDLAERFGITDSHVSNIFITWVSILNKVLTNQNIWMSKRKVVKNMPDCFKPLYKDVRVVIDCTEMRIEKPSDCEAQAASYSQYKSSNTLKALIGISPSGVTTFVSDLYEGKISDNEITMRSGLFDLMQKGDAVMCDRGWTCREAAAKRGIRLITPHFLQRDGKLDLPQLVESVAIARVRIHVERIMGRIKQWHFLTRTIHLTQWDSINHIFNVCARLTMFWPPLVE